MRRRYFSSLAIGIFGAMVALPTGAQEQSYRFDVSVTDILTWPLSGIHDETFMVIENETEWCELWEEIFGEDDAQVSCDTSVIDFRTQAMLAANLGDRPDLCFDVSITGVERRGRSGHIMVDALEMQYTTGCVCPLVITQPLHVVAIDKPVDKAVFNKEFVALACDP